MDLLKSVHIEGFKSIRDATIDLGPLTVLIGANGSGKSNFVSFLKMVKAMGEKQLQRYVGKAGGGDTLFHFGSATTEQIAGRAVFALPRDEVCYEFTLIGTEDDSLVFVDEWLPGFSQQRFPGIASSDAPYAHHETGVLRVPEGQHERASLLASFISDWQAFHLQDTSPTAAVRRQHYIDDNRQLHSDAGNLAAYLYMLREVERPYYDRIIGAFRLAAPWFDDFVMEPLELRPEDVKLNWREKGGEKLFGPHELSDGSLRTIALFTLLLQPEERLPSLIVIDEPELGLHPYVITLLGSLLRSASVTTQVIVATQSVTLLNHFAPPEIVVVERDREGGTTFMPQSEARLKEWLERYSVGELWEKNVLGGRP